MAKNNGLSAAISLLVQLSGCDPKELAETAGISPRMINYILKGEKTPSNKTLQKIASFFRLNSSQVMELGEALQAGVELDREGVQQMFPVVHLDKGAPGPVFNMVNETLFKVSSSERFLINMIRKHGSPDTLEDFVERLLSGRQA